MFRSKFQGGCYVEVFNVHQKNPTENWKLSTSVIRKVYDKQARGFVLPLFGNGVTTWMQLPQDIRHGLGLTQSVLVLQLILSTHRNFHLEISVSVISGGRKRICISTSQRKLLVTTLLAVLPLLKVKEEKWLHLCLDLEDLISGFWNGEHFHAIECITVKASCWLKRIFTLNRSHLCSLSDKELDGEHLLYFLPHHLLIPGEPEVCFLTSSFFTSLINSKIDPVPFSRIEEQRHKSHFDQLCSNCGFMSTDLKHFLKEKRLSNEKQENSCALDQPNCIKVLGKKGNLVKCRMKCDPAKQHTSKNQIEVLTVNGSPIIYASKDWNDSFLTSECFITEDTTSYPQNRTTQLKGDNFAKVQKHLYNCKSNHKNEKENFQCEEDRMLNSKLHYKHQGCKTVPNNNKLDMCETNNTSSFFMNSMENKQLNCNDSPPYTTKSWATKSNHRPHNSIKIYDKNKYISGNDNTSKSSDQMSNSLNISKINSQENFKNKVSTFSLRNVPNSVKISKYQCKRAPLISCKKAGDNEASKVNIYIDLNQIKVENQKKKKRIVVKSTCSSCALKQTCDCKIKCNVGRNWCSKQERTLKTGYIKKFTDFEKVAISKAVPSHPTTVISLEEDEDNKSIEKIYNPLMYAVISDLKENEEGYHHMKKTLKPYEYEESPNAKNASADERKAGNELFSLAVSPTE